MNDTVENIAIDGSQHRFMSALGYIVFFIPLILASDSKFARFHANQGLVLFLFALVVWILSSAIPLIGWLILGPIGSILILLFAVIGILNALNGRAKNLPLIGKYRILKKI